MPTDLTGQLFGSFKLISQLGRGGMATVYQGYQESIDRTVAVKVLPAEFLHDPNFSQRFLAEARMLAKLAHPAILPLYDFGYANDVPFIVMPLMANGTLTEKIKQNPLSLAEALRIFTPIADALDFANKQGVLHRDVKPSNILFDQNDNPFLADFGIAKAMESASSLTGTGIVGTPDFMSPEQARGEQLDGRSDQYSLSVMIYQALTGNPLFRATTPIAVMLKHATETPPPIITLRPDLPAHVNEAIAKALSKYPSERFATCAEFLQAFKEAVATAPTKLSDDVATLVEAKRASQATQAQPVMWNESAPARVTPPTPAVPYTPPPPAKRGGGNWLVSGGIGMFLGVGLLTLFICGGCVGLYLIGSSITPTPTPQPTEPPLVTIFTEPFNGPNPTLWATLSNNESQTAITNGDYVVKLNKEKWFTWATANGKTFKNVQIEVLAKPAKTNVDAIFGLICNYKDKDNYYYAGIDNKGNYTISKFMAQKDQRLSNNGEWKKSALIPQNADEYSLTLECADGIIALYVGNDWIAQVTDNSFDSGGAGFFVWSAENPKAEVRFDEFTVNQFP